MQQLSLKVLRSMSVPVATMLCRLAKIRETVNHMVKWQEANSLVSPGLLIETLVICILCDRKPLWKVEQFWAAQDLAHLFPHTGLTYCQLNDDAYGHALDKLAEIDQSLLISLVSLTLLQAHDLQITSLHLDTTSKSVQGAYAQEKSADFSVCHGFSKDLRPDLKQFKIGLAVQEQGLPVMGEMLSGNVADSRWNPQAVLAMQSFFANKGFRDVLFVSDCALVSTAGLQELARKHIRFISRLPETFALAETLKEQAFEKNQWQNAGTVAETTNRTTASYQLYSTRETLDGREYRFVVVQSSALEAKKEKTLRRRATLRQDHWEKTAKKLDSQVFACEADAQAMLTGLQRQIAKEHFQFEGTVVSEEIRTYSQKGRPKKGQQPQSQIVYHTQCTVGEMDAVVWEDWKRKESTFILITTELDEERYNTLRILTEYKQQIGVESRFRVLKDPVYLGPIYLKNEKRIQALGYVFILVLLLACYLEYRVRTKLKQMGETVKLPGNKSTATPSVMTILEILETIHVVSIGGVRYFPDNVTPQALKMIEWSGFLPRIYLDPLPSDT